MSDLPRKGNDDELLFKDGSALLINARYQAEPKKSRKTKPLIENLTTPERERINP